MLTALAIFGLFAPMALLGIPYRIGQAITGTLRARLKATHGWRQISGGSGVTLLLVNVPMLIYTLGFFLYFFLRPPSESVGPTLFLLLGLCGVGYAVMEVLLIPLPPLPSPQSLQHIWRGSLFANGGLFVVLSLALMLSVAFGTPRSTTRYLRMILYPQSMLALWLASGLILNVGAALMATKRPLYFALSSMAVAAGFGFVLDLFLFMHHFFTLLLAIIVGASAATVVFLNRQNAKA